LDSLTLEDGNDSTSETSVSKHLTPCNNPEDRRIRKIDYIVLAKENKKERVQGKGIIF
jgi:hypothetical protein